MTQEQRDNQNNIAQKFHYTRDGAREMERLPSDLVDKNQRANFDPNWDSDK